jgi:hypothetical protein
MHGEQRRRIAGEVEVGAETERTEPGLKPGIPCDDEPELARQIDDHGGAAIQPPGLFTRVVVLRTLLAIAHRP